MQEGFFPLTHAMTQQRPFLWPQFPSLYKLSQVAATDARHDMYVVSQSSHPRTSVRLQASLQQVSSSRVALLCPNALSPPPQPIPLIGLQGEVDQGPAPLLDWGGWGGSHRIVLPIPP